MKEPNFNADQKKLEVIKINNHVEEALAQINDGSGYGKIILTVHDKRCTNIVIETKKIL